MDFFWILVAMPVLALLYSAYLIARGNKHQLPDYVVPLPTSTLRPMANTDLSHEGRRDIKWISIKELETLASKTDDVIFIDLRSPDERKSIPFPIMHALSLTPSHLLEVLQWLPPETSVVLYGASDFCTSMIWTIRKIAGVAPVYVLTPDPMHSEVV